MKHHYSTAGTLICCLVLCFAAAQGQPSLWGTLDNSSNPDLVFYVRLGEAAIETPVPMGVDSRYGNRFPQLVRGADGNMYGLNQNMDGYMFYRIDKQGVAAIHQFEYADGGEFIEGNDGFFYKFSNGVDGNYIVITRFKADGSERATNAFYKPHFSPDKLIVADGAIYGLNTAGGANQGSGYIYRFTPGADLTDLDIIYNFSPATGRKPAGGLIEGPDGFLYGVTTSGGVLDFGTVFKVSKDGSQYIKLHDFDFTNGRYPKTGLMLDASGWLYGTATQGGANRKGVIFKIRTDGTGYTVLHHFSQSYGGPAGELALYNGNLYGYENPAPTSTAPVMIYRLQTSDNTFSRIVTFSSGTMARQNDELFIVDDPFVPDLYATTPADSATGVSRNARLAWAPIAEATQYAFEYSKTADFSSGVTWLRTWKPEATLSGLDYATRYYLRIRSNVWPAYGPVTSFTTEQVPASANRITNPANGATGVAAPVLKVTANLVAGATRYTIELSTSPEFTNPRIRTSASDHQRTLIFDSLAYATKYYGRVKTDISGYGIVTSFTTKAETFASLTQPAHEATAQDPLVVRLQTSPIPGAKRYTVQLGTREDFGGQLREFTSFSDHQTSFIAKDLLHGTRYYARIKSDISTAFGPVTYFDTRHEIAEKRLWGVASSGGANNIGTVFSYSIDSARLVKHYDFLYPSTYPDESEVLYGTIVPGPDGSFYFHSSTPGASAYTGTIFHMDRAGAVEKLIDIGLYQGRMMLASDDHIYATVDDHMGPGVIRKHALGSNEYEQVFSFSGQSRGTYPGVQLLELNGYLYGTAVNGGINGGGTLYRIRHDGSDFKVIHYFSDIAQGSKPNGNLALGADGYLYGTTVLGGIYGHGSVFKVLPDGTSFAKLFDFNGTNGKRPYGGVVVVNGVIYGTTGEGGPAGQGTIFKLNTNGLGFVNMYNFTGGSGYKPVAQLTVYNNMLYGMTSGGGSFSRGVIFRIGMNGTGFTKLVDLTAATGGNPVGSLVLREDTFSPAAPAAGTSERIVVNVHPNPTTTHFTVELASEKESQARAVVTDMRGEVIDESVISSTATWQTGDALQKGIYLLKVTSGEKTTTHRIIKK